MTQAFCHIILHFSIASLSWKTIKSLRRSRNRHWRKKCDGDSVPLDENNDCDVVTKVEYEILKGWTIISFHYLYVSTGIEFFVRFVVPFYFHLKMIALVVTFVVPSWTMKIHGSSGLSPVVSYWFDYLIVPGVHRVHALMGNDPKEWAKQQLAMIPLLFLDWFILPGVLSTDEEKELVRKRRREEDNANASPHHDVFKLISSSNLFPENPSEEPIISNDSILHDSNQSAQAQPSRSSILPKQSHDRSYDQSLPKEVDNYYQSEEPHAETVINVSKSRTQHDDVSGRKTPPRVLRESTLFPRTNPTPSRDRITIFNSALSPTAKRRLETSASKLKRISQEYRLVPSHEIPSRGYTSPYDADNTSVSKVVAPITVMRDKTQSTRRKRGERLSLGDHFRELVTGDASIRVRDHLFDLDLPASPRRHLQDETRENRTRNGVLRDIDASHITTRRSSRLTRKNGG